MEYAQVRKKINDEMSHRKYTMISQKQQYLKQLRDKRFSAARKMGTQRQQINRWIIIVTFWNMMNKAYTNFKHCQEE